MPECDSLLIDFTELRHLTPGEGLEILTKALLEMAGLSATWSGRGADGGQDLIAVETLPGALLPYQRRWVVQCKDYASSNKSVGANDVGNIHNVLSRHHAIGYLLVTTTVLSSSAVELLRGVKDDPATPYVTAYWDRHKLTEMLVLPGATEILRRHLPNSLIRLQSTLPDAVLIGKLRSEGIDSESLERIQSILARAREKQRGWNAEQIFPFPSSQRQLINDALDAFLDRDESGIGIALEQLGYEEWLAVVSAFKSKDSEFAETVVRSVAETASEPERRFAALSTLTKEFGVDFVEVIDLCERLDSETLELLVLDSDVRWSLAERVEHAVREDSGSLLSDLPPHSYVGEVDITRVDAEWSDRAGAISLRVEFTVDVDIEDHEGDALPSGNFPGVCTVLLRQGGDVEVEVEQVDTSSWFD